MSFDDHTITTNLNTTVIKTGLHIILTTDEDDSRPVYLSGNFNNWLTQDKAYVMEKIGSGLYHFKFTYDYEYPDTLLYKFTKGDWSEVEIDADGNITSNRSTTNHSGVQKEHVSKWRRNWLPFKPNYLPKIVLISDEFEIPQLNKTRKIVVKPRKSNYCPFSSLYSFMMKKLLCFYFFYFVLTKC